jgi:hypothetical protein
MTRSRTTAVAALLIIIAAMAAEVAMGRNAICSCGAVDLWVGDRDSPQTSQMLADWYSLSHVVHGLLFYALLRFAFRRWPTQYRFIIALLIEALWEVLENSPFVIDRYRQTAAALGYTGDSVLNSVSDIVMMSVGFMLARRLPVRASLCLLVFLEFVPLLVIRDNLALNILNLLAPIPAVEAWQNGR